MSWEEKVLFSKYLFIKKISFISLNLLRVPKSLHHHFKTNSKFSLTTSITPQWSIFAFLRAFQTPKQIDPQRFRLHRRGVREPGGGSISLISLFQLLVPKCATIGLWLFVHRRIVELVRKVVFTNWMWLGG